MPKFVFAYHGGNTDMTPEAGQAMMTQWRNWVAGLGAAMVDPGHAVGESITISPSGVAQDGGANPISGVSVVEAASLEAATEMARVCPHITLVEGSIEIAPVLDMDM
ncbi:hypothetical protein HY29_07500 [Hyphomonas beringensis]|uniref:YCII-related domain-containing protein n=1 Tax=Hyphomonas beringensis TaxID=1280946 RepID=A0A062ULG6_9PROT|nr:YciI family protein [Hyphomonas beringensis]KCZ56980.1 hypothetical protein HY29_07500 [Hyphomonas beringensis]